MSYRGGRTGYLTKFGVGVGTKWRAEAGKPPHTMTAATMAGTEVGALGAGSWAPQPKPLTEAELSAMAQAVR